MIRALLILVSISLFITGCGTICEKERSDYLVHYTEKPIKIDGKLDDPAWSKAAVLPFSPLPKFECTETGEGKILWDDKYVYISAVFKDSDIVQESNENWTHLYSTGDLLEVFIKPVGKRFYWEIYGTPNSKKSSFFYPSKGRLGLPSGFAHKVPQIKTAANLKGTLNDLSDVDINWTIEIAIPIKELERPGAKVAPGAKWIFHLGRYNYSAHLDNKELSTTGYPTTGSFHDFSMWNRLVFVK